MRFCLVCDNLVKHQHLSMYNILA